jgi:predicted kinase
MVMEAIVFAGIQGSGKTTFYKQRFFETHVRISLDMLRTRNRESILFRACLEAKQPFVVDNTNPTRAERAVYIQAAKAGGFRVICYYFRTDLEASKRRNQERPAEQVIPLAGLLGTYMRLEVPSPDEGFDQMWYVRAQSNGGFDVEAWQDEVR